MAAQSAIRRAVIDTGPLLSALIVNHLQLQQTKINPRRLLDKADESVRSAAAQPLFLQFLADIREKLTTSHVFGEINGLVNSRLNLHDPELSRFWNSSIDLLTQWNFDERLIKLLEFTQGSATYISRLGIVDTGLIRLARESGSVLITVDDHLARSALEQGTDCRLLRNLF